MDRSTCFLVTIWPIGGLSDPGQLLASVDVAKHRFFHAMEVLDDNQREATKLDADLRAPVYCLT